MPELPRIRMLPDEIVFETADGESILDAALRAGVPMQHECGGNARCSTCRFTICVGAGNLSPRTADEEAIARQLYFAPTVRLACQTKATGDVTVERPEYEDSDVRTGFRASAEQPPADAAEEMAIAILFSDISGYTPFSEGLPPYDVVHVLNRYFRMMDEAIQRNGGYFSTHSGDGIMALFGIGGGNHATLNAVEAGLEMFRALDNLNPYFQSMYGDGLRIRVGVHYGQAVVGRVGVGESGRVTAIGDAVNLARRIEEANKQLGTSFLISHDAYLEVSERVLVSRAFRTPLRGKTGQFTVYEVSATRDAARSE